MASKISLSRLAFFFSINLLFSMLATTTCTSFSLPKFQPPPLPHSGSIFAPTSPYIDEEKCPRDGLKIGICAKVLSSDFLKVIVGEPPVAPCCTLIAGLADLEAALCLCTAIKASVLGIDLLNVPIALSLLANNCGEKVPASFQCP